MPKTGGSVFRHKSGLSGLSTAEAREALVVSEGAGPIPAPPPRKEKNMLKRHSTGIVWRALTNAHRRTPMRVDCSRR